MNGVRVAVHQSKRRSESRKLASMRASPSVAVVDEMAPRCITASSLRPSSQRRRSAGGTKSATCRPPRLRHLPSLPRLSLTAMSVRPASLRLATRLDPMNPAPPVINNIDAVEPVDNASALSRPLLFAGVRGLEQHLDGPNERAYRRKPTNINELRFIS